MNLIKLDLVSDISLNESANQEKDRLVSAAAVVTEVSNPEQCQLAVRVGKQIKQLLNEVEDAREQVKKPVLDLGRKIDSMAKGYILNLTIEMERLRQLVAGFQHIEAQKLLEEQQRRQEELKKAEEDRIAALKLAQETAAQATTEDAGFNEAEEAMLAEAMKKEAEAKQQELLKAPEPTMAKPKGAVVKPFELQYRINDLPAFQKARPDLVNLEPKRSAIRDCLHQLWVNQEAGNPTPGIEVYQETSVSFRG